MSVHDFSGDKSVLASMRDISDRDDSPRHAISSIGTYATLLLLNNAIVGTLIGLLYNLQLSVTHLLFLDLAMS